LIVTVAGRFACRRTACFASSWIVSAVLLSNGVSVTTPLVMVVCRGPCSAAAYLNASLIRLMSMAAPMRLPQ